MSENVAERFSLKEENTEKTFNVTFNSNRKMWP